MRNKGGSKALPKARVSETGTRNGTGRVQHPPTAGGGIRDNRDSSQRAVQTGLFCCLRNAFPCPGPHGLGISRPLTTAFTFIRGGDASLRQILHRSTVGKTDKRPCFFGGRNTDPTYLLPPHL